MRTVRVSESLISVGAAVLTVLGLLIAPAERAAAQRGRGNAQPPARDEAARARDGAIDIHVHSLPDNVPRSVDIFEAATLARVHGMRGLVLKNHYDPTAGFVYLVRQQVPGLEVFGGIDLNLSVG